MASTNKIPCGIFTGIVALFLVIGCVLIGLAYSGYIWSETTGKVQGVRILANIPKLVNFILTFQLVYH